MSSVQGRRRVWVVWLLFLALLAGIVIHETRHHFEPKVRSDTGRVPMFSFREAELSRIEAVYEGRSAALSRNAAGEWTTHHAGHRHDRPDNDAQHHDHSNREASTAIAEQVAVVAGMLADRQVHPEQSLDQYGLRPPRTMIAFYGRKGDEVDTAQPLSVLYVGDLLPTQYEYYTMRDGDEQLSLVPRYYIVLLLALVFEEDQVPTLLPVHDEIRAPAR